MKRLNELIKLEGTSNYFNKVILTDKEFIKQLMAKTRPSFLKQVVANYDELEYLKEGICYHKNAKVAFESVCNECKSKYIDMKSDLIDFSLGKLDLLDLSVKYGVYYKDCKRLFLCILNDIDVNSYWKKSKKFKCEKVTKELYGVDHTSKLESVRLKKERTIMNKYGVDNAMKNESIKLKCRESNLINNGFEYAFSKINKGRWNDIFKKHLSKSDSWKKIIDNVVIPDRRDFAYKDPNNKIKDLLLEYIRANNCLVKYPDDVLFSLNIQFPLTLIESLSNDGLVDVSNMDLGVRSKWVDKVYSLLKELGINFIENSRTVLDGFEIDFYIPDLKLGIEVNPTSTHSSNKFKMDAMLFNRGLYKNYHYDKYKLAAKNGILLIQLFEWDLINDKWDSVTKFRLRDRLIGFSKKIYARNTRISVVKYSSDKRIAREFLNKYHSSGADRAKIYYIMKDKLTDDIVGVASFVYNKLGAELKRLCFKPGVLVVGGVSKIINQFLADNVGINLYTYSDNNFGNGNGYKKAGAKFIRETGAGLVFVNRLNAGDKYSQNIRSYCGAKQGVLVNDGFNDEINMSNIEKYIECELSHRVDSGKGYNVIYTAGSKLWCFENKNDTIGKLMKS